MNLCELPDEHAVTCGADLRLERGRRRRTLRAGCVLGPLLLVGALAISTAGTPAAAGSAQTGPPQVAPADVLVIGDSLGVGLRSSLGEMLPDRALTFNVRHGRTTPQGMSELRHELEHLSPRTVVISLGTNDGPSETTFADRIHRALLAIPTGTCVVWPAVTRPPRKGAYHGLNRALRDQARQDHRLTVVSWDRMVSKGTIRLPDDIHPDADGFRMRSWVIAAAVRRGCDGGSDPGVAQQAESPPAQRLPGVREGR